jgi:hypothetical protein
MSLYSLIPPRDPELLRLVEAVVLQGRSLAIKAKSEGKRISSYQSWPELSWLESGFPSVHVSPFSGPVDYSQAFSAKEDRFAGPVIYSDLPSFQNLISYAQHSEQLRARLLPPRRQLNDPIADDLLRFEIVHIATAIIDRTMHTYGDEEINTAAFRKFYLEMEAPLFDDQLSIEILTPIALTKFEAEERMELAANIFLERMDDGTHQARYPRSSLWLPAQGIVISAATHALVLSNYVMPATNVWERYRSELSLYPVDVVDRFFAALRLVTGIQTGYAQIVLRPIAWAEDYMATLPPLIAGPSVHRYPDRFDNYGWLAKDRHLVTANELSEVASTFSDLLDAPDAISLATRRLNSAMLRTDEADSIIDLCIGLEALLTDETQTEMTHKLALRIAALSTLSEERKYTPEQVFRAVKRIYNYRSKLVHGRTDAASHRTIPFLEPPHNQAPDVAADLLRQVVRTLLRHASYLTPSKIDIELIAAGMGARDDVDEGPTNGQA